MYVLQVKKVEVPLATPHGADLFKQNEVSHVRIALL
jgi:hypothetical protein